MATFERRLLALLGGVAVLLAVGGAGSSSSHQLLYFQTGVSEPVPGLPRFVAVGYVDDQLIDHYDSITRRAVPQAPWMEKNEDPQYWEGQSEIAAAAESAFRIDLVTIRERYNQRNSTGLHTWQLMYGCEVGPDGQLPRGYYQFAYDGEDFIALDMKTLTWTARIPQAQETKRRWEAEVHYAQRFYAYLEEECVESLKMYLDFGKEALTRTERPMARVARKEGYDGRETLTCQLYGFYPREIDVTWMKDGQVWDQDIFLGGVIPNSDGTYHTWRSIEVDPKEKNRYRCRVEHDSLTKPLELAWEEPASPVWLIVGVLAGILIAVLLVIEVALYMKKRSQPKGVYKAPPGSDQGSDCSIKAFVPEA